MFDPKTIFKHNTSQFSVDVIAEEALNFIEGSFGSVVPSCIQENSSAIIYELTVQKIFVREDVKYIRFLVKHDNTSPHTDSHHRSVGYGHVGANPNVNTNNHVINASPMRF